jgi:hypothetical protein
MCVYNGLVVCSFQKFEKGPIFYFKKLRSIFCKTAFASDLVTLFLRHVGANGHGETVIWAKKVYHSTLRFQFL